MLGNEKHAGRWVWGMTTTRRDSQGRKKQVPVPAGQEVVRERPDLLIIVQALWDKAAARLAQLDVTFGFKDGQKPRGPRPSPADVYPQSPLGGVLVCGSCGARMWQHHSNARRYYACPGAKKGLCSMSVQVPAGRAEKALTDFLLDLLRGWPAWMSTLHRLTCDAVRVAAGLARRLDGCDLAGFGISGFDLPLLAAEFARAGIPFRLTGRAVLDALGVFQSHEPRDLSAAVRFYLGRDHAGAHSAAADTLAAAAEILDEQVRRYGLPVTPAALHAALVEVDVAGKFRRADGGVAFAFGKYAGRPLADVAAADPGDLEWVLARPFLDDVHALVRGPGRALKNTLICATLR